MLPVPLMSESVSLEPAQRKSNRSKTGGFTVCGWPSRTSSENVRKEEEMLRPPCTLVLLLWTTALVCSCMAEVSNTNLIPSHLAKLVELRDTRHGLVMSIPKYCFSACISVS